VTGTPREHVGRFAPSPTGPLHFGSVVAALGSYTAARAAGGRWYVRIDDIDPPRAAPGAIDTILHQLEALGLEWDGSVLFQSRRHALYRQALERLEQRGLTYACTCTRREIHANARHGPLGPVYPGTCRHRPTRPERDSAVRLRMPAGELALDDGVQGRYALDASALGDVVLRRRDGLWAYHLATAVDDVHLGITHVVRGADLLPAALVQSALHALLEEPLPNWSHLPVVQGPDGAKLSKQTGAAAVDAADPVSMLLRAWRFLGQPAPASRPEDPAGFHRFAAARWSPRRVPRGPGVLPSSSE